MFYSHHKYSFSSGTTCLIIFIITQWINLGFASCKGDLSYSDYNKLNSSDLARSVRSPDDHSDSILYVGYSNNPWGPSAMLDSGPTHMTSTSSHRRSKRGVFDLYNMVFCATGCDPLAFKGYGCYCGFLGSGYTVDGIDRCCKMHDWCYASANCPMFLEYFIPYLWKCYRRIPLCAIDQGGWGTPSSCAQRLCECDRHLAECLRRYPCPRTKAVCTSSPWRLLQNVFML